MRSMISSGVSFTLKLGPSSRLPQFTVVNPSTFTYINAIAVAFIQISLFFEAVGVSLIIRMVLLLGYGMMSLLGPYDSVDFSTSTGLHQ